MIRTVQIAWQSDCGKAHIEERNGLLWCYIGADHVGTQISLDAAVKLVNRKMEGEG
jgi:hypothetical protein